MKKLIGAALAAVLLFPPGQASAEILKNLKVGGQLDIQMNSARNAVDFTTHQGANANNYNDRIGDTLTRVLLDLDWDLLDDVHAQVGLRKNDRAWADMGNTGQGQGQNQAVLNNGATSGALDNTYVQRANITIDKMMGRFDITLGRQYYGMPGDLVIYYGPKDVYGLNVTSLDAMSVRSEGDWISFVGAAGRIDNGDNFAVTANQIDVRGMDVMWKNLPMKVHTFAWNRVTHQSGTNLGTAVTRTAAAVTAGSRNDQLWVYGLKLRGEAGGGWLSFDAAFNSGADRLSGVANTAACTVRGCIAPTAKYNGRAFLVDLGFNLDLANIGGFTPWANFGWGSGRSSLYENKNEGFQAISTDYRPGIINRRFSPMGQLNLGVDSLTALNIFSGGVGTAGLSNRVVWGGGLNFIPAYWDQLTFGVQYWDFRFQRNTLESAAFASNSGNRHIGSEAGLTLTWNHSENVLLTIGGATFQPGGYIREVVATNNAGGAVERGHNPVTTAFADWMVRF